MSFGQRTTDFIHVAAADVRRPCSRTTWISIAPSFIGQRALELMKTYGSSADPRSYEVWYTYVSGHKPAMNEAIKKITAEHGSLNRQRYRQALRRAPVGRNARRATPRRPAFSCSARSSRSWRCIELALGSTAKYGESLQAFSNDLDRPPRSHAHPRTDRDASVARHASGHRHQPAARSQAEGDARRDRNPARDSRMRPRRSRRRTRSPASRTASTSRTCSTRAPRSRTRSARPSP